MQLEQNLIQFNWKGACDFGASLGAHELLKRYYCINGKNILLHSYNRRQFVRDVCVCTQCQGIYFAFLWKFYATPIRNNTRCTHKIVNIKSNESNKLLSKNQVLHTQYRRKLQTLWINRKQELHESSSQILHDIYQTVNHTFCKHDWW